MEFVKFFQTGRDRTMFRVPFAKLRKNDLKSTISSRLLPIFPKKIVKFNMQYMTATKCITTHKTLGKSGVFYEKKWHSSHYVSILPPIPLKIQVFAPHGIYVFFRMNKTWASYS